MEYYLMLFDNRWEHTRFADWFYFIYSGKTGLNDYIFYTSHYKYVSVDVFQGWF